MKALIILFIISFPIYTQNVIPYFSPGIHIGEGFNFKAKIGVGLFTKFGYFTSINFGYGYTANKNSILHSYKYTQFQAGVFGLYNPPLASGIGFGSIFTEKEGKEIIIPKYSIFYGLIGYGNIDIMPYNNRVYTNFNLELSLPLTLTEGPRINL